MRVAYFDCFSGASGDMTVGAFLDAGVDFAFLRRELSRLPLNDYILSSEKILKKGISGTQFKVKYSEKHNHRSFKVIAEIITSAGFEKRIEEKALGIFRLLAEAESEIHGVSVEDVTFHEVGAVDSIVDIVAAAVGAEALEIDEFRSSPLPLGGGFTDSSHGRLPLPAPAVVRILKDAPVYDPGVKGELVTPTGAAIIKYLASDFGGYPEMNIVTDGYGGGTKDFDLPNLLRVVIGEKSSAAAGSAGSVLVAETNIDDMNPEFYGFVIERLFAAGALDALVIPAIMKKGRPGAVLKVVFKDSDRTRLLDIIFKETTTAGVRVYRTGREFLNRRIEDVETLYGTVKVKLLEDNKGKTLTASPEFEDCRRAALNSGVSIREVYKAAGSAADKLSGSSDKPVELSEKRRKPEGKVHVYTGDGKGKTTAALGLILRAAGRGINCKLIRFMKTADSGELHSIGALSDYVSVETSGVAGFCSHEDPASVENHRTQVLKGFMSAEEACSGEGFGLVVLDEIVTACSLGLLEEDELISLIENKSPGLELVMTGRGAGEKIKSAADLVTEMQPVKHYYDSGTTARRGVEF